MQPAMMATRAIGPRQASPYRGRYFVVKAQFYAFGHDFFRWYTGAIRMTALALAYTCIYLPRYIPQNRVVPAYMEEAATFGSSSNRADVFAGFWQQRRKVEEII